MPIVESAGVPIHYETDGTGAPIVLVHGFMSSMENWVQTGWVEFLVARGRSVVRLDVRGHGKSGKPHDPNAYENPRMPDDVLAVMDALGLERVDVMGYSMGAAIAVRLVASHPDRLNSVIAGANGLRLEPSDPERNEAMAAALEADDVSAISDPAVLFLREFADGHVQNTDGIVDTNPDRYAFAAITRRRGGTQTPEAVVAAIRKTRVRLLGVVGSKDPVLPEVQLLTDTVPNAQLVIVPGGDHLTTIPAVAYKDAVATFLRLPTLAGG
jgi:pimeloyl-ACP methyl ester carboxylesterase